MQKQRGFLRYSKLEGYNVNCFTTTRRGGVSVGNYESMNPCLYCNDDVIDVMENRNLLAGYIDVAVKDLYIPYQFHDDKIRIIDQSFLNLNDEEKEQQLHGIDALITQEKNICIAVTTADCVPVLIYDPVNHALGAVHAGWKGTVQRIAAKTVLRMKQELHSEPSKLIVVIGPSISQKMFEVGDEVGQSFIEEGFDLDSIAYRDKKTKKLHIDLWKANVEQLVEEGIDVSNIEISGICTFQDDAFFSARRQSINSGRMITGGVLK